uniref:NAD(P)H oxidoreductase n=1 Tax=Oscillatoriales cyanobacterium SpSt-402 TaxID=2282168 RepID=A0A832M3Q1_9CYAN
MVNPNRILVLFAHPALEKSRVNRQLVKAIRGIDAVTIHDLYEHYPNFHINVKAEQELLLAHDIIVFQHPFYWYSSPAILKEWQDLVLEYGFAYGHHGTALRGKKFLSAITTGGSEQAYCRKGHNHFSIRELLTPFEQTARLCGMQYLPPFVIYDTPHLYETQQVGKYIESYRTAIALLRDNLIDWDHLQSHKHLNYYLDQVTNTPEPPLHVQ